MKTHISGMLGESLFKFGKWTTENGEHFHIKLFGFVKAGTYICMKFVLLFFLSITYWCGALVAWVTQHTNVCLDNSSQPLYCFPFIQTSEKLWVSISKYKLL